MDFVNNLSFIDGNIVVLNQKKALWFKKLYQTLNDCFFKDPKNVYASAELTKLLKQALADDVITLEDFKKDDQYVLDKLEASKIFSARLCAIRKELANSDFKVETPKFKNRVVDPLVLMGPGIVRLSQIVS